jgi:hypothetical protein
MALKSAYRRPNSQHLGMGQGLESSLDPLGTTARAGRPVLVALSAHNWLAHGGRLTAGCPAFLAITTPLPFRDERPIRHSPKCRAACAIAHRHRHRARRRLRLIASGHHARKLVNKPESSGDSHPKLRELISKGSGGGRRIRRARTVSPSLFICVSHEEFYDYQNGRAQTITSFKNEITRREA